MAPQTTIHIIRHAEGYHQLPYDNPNTTLRDPSLTPLGISQVKTFSQNFPHHDEPKLICASPLRRTLQTAEIAFKPELERGARIIALPDAQEATGAPSDTGSEVATLEKDFGDIVDFGLVGQGWYEKVGSNAPENSALHERAKRLRQWLRARPESCIVLVTHGFFAHYITGHIDEHGGQTGEWWTNVMWRSFNFADSDDSSASLVETVESVARGDAEHKQAALQSST